MWSLMIPLAVGCGVRKGHGKMVQTQQEETGLF